MKQETQERFKDFPGQSYVVEGCNYEQRGIKFPTKLYIAAQF